MSIRSNLYVDQGTDYQVTLDLGAINAEENSGLANSQFFCDVKKTFSETKRFSAEMTINVDDEFILLNLFIDKDKTKDLEPGKYYYDVLSRSEVGGVKKILEGLIFLLPTTTSTEQP
jgi:hypothetical protein